MSNQQLTEKQKQSMRRLFEDNGLDKDDVFTHKHYVIIKRSGIEKIEANNKITVTYEPVHVSPEFCVVKAIGKQGNIVRETFASAQYGGKELDKESQKWVDMGTTTIVAHLVDAITLKTLDAKASFNSLGIYGREVTRRMISAEKKGSVELQKLLIGDINRLVTTLANDNGVSLKDITANGLTG